MDVFAALGSGIRFDKKRFQSDIEVFKKGKSASDQADESISELPSIDFFATNDAEKDTQQQLKEKASRKKSSADERQSFATSKNELASSAVDESIPDFQSEEQANLYRKQHRIKVYGNSVPFPIQFFSQLSTQLVDPGLKRALSESGYKEPTPIQKQAIPTLLQSRDLIACAPTGSGKTLAFILPLVKLLGEPSKDGIRALIIAPTRELAAQIHRELGKLIVGGKKKKGLKAVLLSKSNVGHTEKNFDVLICTPMRLVHALEQGLVSLKKVQHLIIDEADKLFEMGFLEQLDEVIAACSHPQIQKALFSATIHSHVEQLAQTVMRDPVRIVIGSKNAVTDDIDQKLLYVGQEEGKLVAIRQMVQQGIRPPVLIFVESIDRAKELFHELIYDGINVDVIHSDRTQAQRDQIIQKFRAGQIWVLIATDLLGRGLDFKGVRLVINYDFPRSLASYVHRVGRTGRAGQKGEAITYFTREDAPYLRTVAQVMRDSGCDVPEWMLNLPKASKMRRVIQRQDDQRKRKREGKDGGGNDGNGRDLKRIGKTIQSADQGKEGKRIKVQEGKKFKAPKKGRQ